MYQYVLELGINEITEYVLFTLVPVTQNNYFQKYPCWSNYQWIVAFHCSGKFHWMDIPQFIYSPVDRLLGFPVGAEVKASACHVGDLCSIPGSGRSPGEGYFHVLALQIKVILIFVYRSM